MSKADQVVSVSLANTPTSRRSDQYEQDSDTNFASTHEPRFVRVCIPEPIHSEIKASNLRDIEKLIVYAVVYESATSPARWKSLSTEMLNLMIGQRGRRRVISYLMSSPHFRASSYEAAVRCRAYAVTGFDLAQRALDDAPIQSDCQLASAQHTSDACFVGGVGVWLGAVVWRFCDLGLVDVLVERARVSLGWDHAEKSARESLKHVELIGAPESNAELLGVALANIPVKIGRNGRIAAKKAEEAREKAKAHVAQIRLFEADPTAHIQRKAGRLYTRLSSLPRWARKQYLRFKGNRRAESVDIRCCYLWCIAANLRQKRLKRGLDIESLNILLDLIESGGFYEELAKRAGVEKSQAKKSFAVMCLFGDRKHEHWGRNRLWFALDAICPLVCDEISAWRRQPGGATRLATFCQRMEGAIMLDGLLPAMAEDGIPCCTIHDGCLVPEGNGEHAAQVIRDRSASLFGRPCFAKVESEKVGV